MQFGKWTVRHPVKIKSKSGRLRNKWECICHCGVVKNIESYDLIHGKSKQCIKCYGRNPKDLTDKVFGEWHVLKLGNNKNGKTHWICSCSCGHIDNVCSASLINGLSTKCVLCYQKSMPIHGYTCKDDRHPLYNLWVTMLSRCENPNHIGFHLYGGRGIKVCERWHNLELFHKDMGERPEGFSIERINVNGDYTPENCKWASNKEQGRNRRNNRILEYQGEKKSLAEWAELLEVKYHTLHKYLTRHSFSKAYKFYTVSSHPKTTIRVDWRDKEPSKPRSKIIPIESALL